MVMSQVRGAATMGGEASARGRVAQPSNQIAEECGS
jgi:hypothetical protein